MKDISEELKDLIDDSYREFALLSEEEASERGGPDKWSRKEILGHLIDSAANNHQRFVRAQFVSELRLPGYQQEEWVKSQGYQGEPWATILQLWRAYNLHLVHVIGQIPAGALKKPCLIGENEPVTLEFIVTDYLRHLRHHVNQILGRTAGPS